MLELRALMDLSVASTISVGGGLKRTVKWGGGVSDRSEPQQAKLNLRWFILESLSGLSRLTILHAEFYLIRCHLRLVWTK